MKLFLASLDFGVFADVLRKMTGDNRRVLIITNARDYDSSADLQETLEPFEKNGFEPQALDLRNYFGRPPEELEEYVSKYDPGLIYSVGGDKFLLATALNISGMDDIIKRRLSTDQSVYGGCSAGAMVASHDIEIYGNDEIPIETIPDYYGVEAVTVGLGLIDEYLVPHIDAEGRSERTKFCTEQIRKIHAEPILLNDADVYIINGNHKEIKRGK